MNVLVFGDILWDLFPESLGGRAIGGAAFNFAAHIARLGANVSFVTAVGDDDLGHEALNKIHKYGISSKYVSVHKEYSTGACHVSVDENGIPSYKLAEGVAFDYILANNADIDAEQGIFDVLYIGTFPQRNDVSAACADLLLHHGDTRYKEIFCDINFRGNFYNLPMVEKCLNNCTILKVSREEIDVFEELGICSSNNEEYLAKFLAEKYNIHLVIITLNKDGAFIYDKDTDSYIFSHKPNSKVVSTVGAGDSFCAAFVYNYIKKQPAEICLREAVNLSSRVVSYAEAVPEF